VVVWHYQHFYYVSPGTLDAGFVRSSQPFYALLWPLYEEGHGAVPLFFSLSGFVFFMLYAEPVQSGAVGPRGFFVFRFARLYPLHAVALLIVAAGQLLSQAVDGTSVVYPCNTGLYFALNLGLISHWLPADRICWSFNAPVWSVSVEVFLYVLFFLFALAMPSGKIYQIAACALVVAIGVGFHYFGGFHLLGVPLICFFAGGFACLVWQELKAWSLALATGASVALAFSLLLSWIYDVNVYIVGVIAFPALLTLLATIQTMRPKTGRSVRILGDISYSSYLLHFPLQLILILWSRHVTPIQFGDPGVWLLFFAFLAAVSVATYHGFEKPVQELLRRRMLRSVPR
jgi:peptidoglycan/LPS O-acetylase OafA/YrhL